MSLGYIFNQHKIVTRGEFNEGVHIARLAVKMDGQHSLGSPCDRALDRSRIEIVGPRIDVHVHWPGACVADRPTSADPRVWRGDDFVAGPDVACQQGHMQRGCAIVHRYTESPVNIPRKGCLESLDGRSEDELGFARYRFQSGLQLRPDASMVQRQVEKGDSHGG